MDDYGGSHFIYYIIIFILTILTGIFYGFSSAIAGLDFVEVQLLAKKGNKKAKKILNLWQHPNYYLNALAILVILTGVVIGYSVRDIWVKTKIYSSYNYSIYLILFISSIITAAIAITLFKRVGTYNAKGFINIFISLISLITYLLFPFTFIMYWIARIIGVAFGIEIHQQKKEMTEKEIISLVGEAHQQGLIEQKEAEMIENIIAFHDTEAGDIMTHRKSVIAFQETVLLSEMIDVMLEEGNSRYPVYRDNIDNIVGIVTYKDALKFLTKNPWAKFKPLFELSGLIREAAFIPETRAIGDLFRVMQIKKIHLAIVVDEYGQTAGIVSMEDIVEEIVGDILDEYDDEEETIRIQKDNTLVVDAIVPIEDIEEKLGVDFNSGDFETLNGYLISLLGQIPTSKDLDKEINTGGYAFKILSIGNKTIGKVRITKNKIVKGE